MSIDTELQKHYALLLGIGSPWEVKTVELKLPEKKVEIELGWQWGAAARCPECDRECSIHDSAPERTWRHLDTMQFTTLLRARTPRALPGTRSQNDAGSVGLAAGTLDAAL